ncbi:hypothetical protein Q6D67_13880 [Haliea sp. E1-2-M8]|uniref:hypothetical protein n=1 Tax=Haliea sp. E1-2-M8 TaxID=3064706 RepID=UPI002725D8D2|nr:hypothetical protein [Haliea sp. E1-2-M8]MDO8862795.1 hypothetical protein [Haliea sp. E1-2-M8]
MNLRILALLAAVLPFAAVHLTWLVAASHGLVEWCNPYIDSCTSISATGRQPPASYVFRGIMLPAAVVLALYWWCNYSWLRGLQPAAGSMQSLRWMLVLGLLACLGLVLYVSVLGEAGTAWRLQRRAGTVLFFSFTFLAQLLLSMQLRGLAARLPQVQGLARGMWWLCCLLLALGVLTVVLQARDGVWYDTVEDAFEWVLSLLLQANFLLGYLVWRRAGWQLQFVQPKPVPRTSVNQGKQ